MITKTETSHSHVVDLDKLTNGDLHKLSFFQDGNPLITMTGEQFASLINAGATVGIERLHKASQKLFEDGIHGRSPLEQGRSYLLHDNGCPGHVASEKDPKICGRCGTHIDSERPDDGGF